MIDEISLEEYKKHPRILEIRFILLFDMFEKEFGYQRTLKMYEAICSAFNGSMNLLMGLINKRFDIKRKAKTKYTRWRQEVIFAAYVHGETIYKVAKDYLNLTPQSLYNKETYDVADFVTPAWLADSTSELDSKLQKLWVSKNRQKKCNKKLERGKFSSITYILWANSIYNTTWKIFHSS